MLVQRHWEVERRKLSSGSISVVQVHQLSGALGLTLTPLCLEFVAGPVTHRAEPIWFPYRRWDRHHCFSPVLQVLSVEPIADRPNVLSLAFQRQPMAAGQAHKTQVTAGGAHWIPLAIAEDAADLVIVAVDEQHR